MTGLSPQGRNCARALTRHAAVARGQLSCERASVTAAVQSGRGTKQRIVSHRQHAAASRRICRCGMRMHACTPHAATAELDDTARSSHTSTQDARSDNTKLSRIYSRGRVPTAAGAAAAASIVSASLADSASAASDQAAAAPSSSCSGLGCAQELLDAFGEALSPINAHHRSIAVDCGS